MGVLPLGLPCLVFEVIVITLVLISTRFWLVGFPNALFFLKGFGKGEADFDTLLEDSSQVFRKAGAPLLEILYWRETQNAQV